MNKKNYYLIAGFIILISFLFFINREPNYQEEITAYLHENQISSFNKVKNYLEDQELTTKESNNIKEEIEKSINLEIKNIANKNYQNYEEVDKDIDSLFDKVEKILNLSYDNNSFYIDNEKVKFTEIKEELLSEYTYYFEITELMNTDLVSAYNTYKEISIIHLEEKMSDIYQELSENIKIETSENIENFASNSDIIDYLETQQDIFSEIITDNTFTDLIEHYQELEEEMNNYDLSNFHIISMEELLDVIKNKELSLIYIGYEGCVYCRKFVPVLNQIIDNITVPIYHVDAESIDYDSNEYQEFEKLASNFTGGYPLIIAFQDEELVDGSLGYMDYDNTMKFFESINITK